MIVAAAPGVAPSARVTPTSHVFWNRVILGSALISVFILITGEWVDLMQPVTSVLGPSASVFFIGVVILGKFLLINLLVAAAAGFLIPITLRRVGIDPAIASAVFLTTVTDVVGFLAFLGLATWVLL